MDLLSTVYDISEPGSLERIDSGDWNRIYKVQADGEWILRISHHRKIQRQLEFELAIVSLLSQLLSYVPKIKPACEGGLFGLYHGDLCSLFEFMPGQPLGVTNATAELAGATLGRIHSELLPISETHRLVNDLSLIRFDWTSNTMYSGDLLDEKALNVEVSDREQCYLAESQSEFCVDIRRKRRADGSRNGTAESSARRSAITGFRTQSYYAVLLERILAERDRRLPRHSGLNRKESATKGA